MPRCIRVLLHWNTDLPQTDIQHVYLGAAASLRPDLNAAALKFE
jgi:chorismate mutase